MKRLFAALLVSFALLGCAQLGLQPAQSFDQKLAYSYGVVTSTRVSASNALQTGTITVADAQQVQALADQARVLLDGARTSSATDVSTAQGKLVLAVSILTQLQTYLVNRGVK